MREHLTIYNDISTQSNADINNRGLGLLAFAKCYQISGDEFKLDLRLQNCQNNAILGSMYDCVF